MPPEAHPLNMYNFVVFILKSIHRSLVTTSRTFISPMEKKPAHSNVSQLFTCMSEIAEKEDSFWPKVSESLLWQGEHSRPT